MNSRINFNTPKKMQDIDCLNCFAGHRLPCDETVANEVKQSDYIGVSIQNSCKRETSFLRTVLILLIILLSFCQTSSTYALDHDLLPESNRRVSACTKVMSYFSTMFSSASSVAPTKAPPTSYCHKDRPSFVKAIKGITLMYLLTSYGSVVGQQIPNPGLPLISEPPCFQSHHPCYIIDESVRQVVRASSVDSDLSYENLNLEQRNQQWTFGVNTGPSCYWIQNLETGCAIASDPSKDLIRCNKPLVKSDLSQCWTITPEGDGYILANKKKGSKYSSKDSSGRWLIRRDTREKDPTTIKGLGSYFRSHVAVIDSTLTKQDLFTNLPYRIINIETGQSLNIGCPSWGRKDRLFTHGNPNQYHATWILVPTKSDGYYKLKLFRYTKDDSPKDCAGRSMYVEYDKDIEITLSSRIQDTYYIKLPGLDNNNKDYPFSTLCSSKQTNPETEWPQVLGLRTDSRLRLITDLSSYECLWRFMPVLEYVDLRMEAEELLIPEDQGIRRENRKLQRKELIDITASCLSGNKAEYRKDFTTQATYFSTFRFVNMTGLQFINSESVQASKGFSEINHESSTNFQSYTNAISVHGGVSFFGFSAGGGFEHSNTRGSYHESGKQLGRYGDITVTKGREEITTENRETGFEISAQRTDISSHSLALYHDCKPKARKVKFSGVASHYIEDEISNRILKARLTATMSRERSDGQIVAKQPVSAAVIEHIIKKLGYQSNMLITSRGEKSDDLGQVSSFIEVYIPIESTIGINRVETDINVEEVFDEGSRPISKDEL